MISLVKELRILLQQKYIMCENYINEVMLYVESQTNLFCKKILTVKVQYSI